jgi:hypothetical protein
MHRIRGKRLRLPSCPQIKNASHKQLASPSMRIVREAFPILTNGDPPETSF